MRIELTDGERSRRERRKGHRRRSHRRSRVLHSMVTWPQAASQARGKRGRGGSARGAQRPQPPGPTQAPGDASQVRRRRQARGRQGRQTEAVERVRGRAAIPWRSIVRRLPALLVLAGLIAACVYATLDARFYVYTAQIAGAHHLPAETIYQAAGVHEQNIFWLDPLRVAERIVQLEGIKAVRVRFELPAQVTIEVEEREPVVMWRASSQQQDLWLDEEGIVLPYHGDADSPDMVFVVDYGQHHLQVGDRIEPEGIVQSVLRLNSAVPGVRVFFYQPGRGLSFSQQVDEGEWPVYVGTSESLSHKIQVVQALTDYLLATRIHPRYVDVRWPDHPVYGRGSGSAAAGGQ